MRLLILGPPGSGKDTQANLIAKYYKIKVIKSGWLLRKEIRKKTEIGKKIKKYLERGDLASDKLVDEIVTKEVKKNKKGFIIDGFPRDISQAKRFKQKIDYVISLDCKRSEIIKRLLKRKRGDDSLKVIKHRWKVHRKRTVPVIKYYKKKGLILKIDGNPPIKQVFKEIKEKLNENRKFVRRNR